MKLINLLLLVLLSFFMGCQQQIYNKEDTNNSNADRNGKTIQTAGGAQEFEDWSSAVNSKSINDIKGHYSPNAIKVISADSIINSSQKIAEYYRGREETIRSTGSLFQISANEKMGINYEIVKIKTEKMREYTQLVIWRLEGERQVRAFEFTAENDSNSKMVDKKKISERRGLWIKLCNENNAENLINELYSPNTLYFNHKPIIKGTENLIREYAYMNNENYNLTLHPLKLEPVTEHIAFEIGQCKGSYGGKYILVWKKGSDRKWKIFIDSNI